MVGLESLKCIRSPVKVTLQAGQRLVGLKVLYMG